MKIKNLIGEMSGSVGALTFSRNRYGFYVKNRPNPVNPDTLKQRAARLAFASASKAWASMPAENKPAWQEYGQTIFTSLTGTKKVSGSAAFTSLYNAWISQFNVSPDTAIHGNDNIVITKYTDTLYIAKEASPPADTVKPSFKVPTSGEYATAINLEPTYSPSGATSLKFDLSVHQLVGEDDSPLVSSNGYFIGFNVYVSSPFTNQGGFANRPTGTLIMSAPRITVEKGKELESILMSTTAGKAMPIGSWVRLTLVVVDYYGQQTIVDAVDVQVGS